MQNRLLLAIAIAVAGCQSRDPVATAPTMPAASAVSSADLHHGPSVRSDERPPADQLERVKRATIRYRDVRNAMADGYADINVVLPNMGRHFLNDGLVDGTFEVERPELLVYQPGRQGGLELVAVEYAVPLNLSAEAPEGFRGGADVWFPSQQFGLWLLHAWVWKENPDGVFNPTNSRVP
jgi:hypothetical protein